MSIGDKSSKHPDLSIYIVYWNSYAVCLEYPGRMRL